MSDLHDHARAFGGAANSYERGRPDYPDALLGYLRTTVGIKPGWRVLDVGAGTGKFTRLLERTGADLVAVEPVAGMRAVCAAELPDVPVLAATASALPFRSGSLRAVTAAQAFHWFATPESVAELRRVLVDEGVLALIWNVRDESVPWVAELSRLLAPGAGEVPRYKDGGWRSVIEASGAFGALWHATFAHAQSGPPEFLEDRVASISYVAAMAEAERRPLLDRVRELAHAHAAAGELVLPYRCEIFWTTARSRLPGRWGHGCRGQAPSC